MSYPVNLQALPSGILEEVFTPDNMRGRASMSSLSPLSFPKSRSALWDSSPMGEKLHLQFCTSRKPRVVLLEKALRLAQRHLRRSNKPRLLCFFLGSVAIDKDEEGLTVTLDRFDPGRDQAGSPGRVPSTLVPGDVLVSCLFYAQSELKPDYAVQPEAELHQCFKLLQQAVSGRQSLDLSQLLRIRACVFCSQQSDATAFALGWSAVCPAVSVDVQPVRAIPIIPTALLRSLTSVGRPLQHSGRQRGFLTMDQTRKLVLLLESDPKASKLPLVGLWLSGVAHVSNPQVWAWCLRFMFSSALQDRVLSESGCFLLVVFASTHRAPQFFQCRGSGAGPGSQMGFHLLTASQSVTLYQCSTAEGRALQCELGSEERSRPAELFRNAQMSYSSSPPPAAGLSDQDSGVEDEDFSPRPSPSPHLPAPQARRVQPSVPELSLLIDSSFTSNHSLGSAHKKPAPPVGPSSKPVPPLQLHSTPNSNLQQPCTCCSTHNCTSIVPSPALLPAAAGPPACPHHTPPPSHLRSAPPPSLDKQTPPPSRLRSASSPALNTQTPPPSHLCPAPSPALNTQTPPPSHLCPAPSPSLNKQTPPPSILRSAPSPSLNKQTPSPSHLCPAPTPLDNQTPPASHLHSAPSPFLNKQTPPPSILHSAPSPSLNKQTPPPSHPCPAPTHLDNQTPPASHLHSSSPPLNKQSPPPSIPQSSPTCKPHPVPLLTSDPCFPPPPSDCLSVLPASTHQPAPSFGLPPSPPSHLHNSPPSSLNPATHHHTPLPPSWLSAPPPPFLPLPWHTDSPSPHPSCPAAAGPASPLWPPRPPCRCDHVGQPDTYQLLLHQDRQLRLLQAQVQMLLEAQGKLQSSTQPASSQTPTSTASVAVGTGASLFWGSSPQQEEPAPPPSSPKPPPSASSSPSTSSHEPSATKPVNAPQNDEEAAQAAPCSPPAEHSLDRLQSPVLGESVSMYEPEEEQQSFYQNLMTQLSSRLQEADAQQEAEEESMRRSLSVSDRSQTCQQKTEGDPVVTATLRRLQQLGVDVDQEVLTDSDRNRAKAVESASTLASISPAAVISRLSVSEPTASTLFPGGSVDLSLEANAIALRYLSDSQLCRLSLGGHAPQKIPAPSSGNSLLSPSNMSLATRKYMRRYGLIEEEDGEEEEEETPAARQPLTEAQNTKPLPQSQLIRDLRPKMQLLADSEDKENRARRQPSLNRAGSRLPEGSVGNILDLSRLRQLPKLF
ncbi:SCL-interrupting locus protein homolog isoform 2-T2 [Menidia menidia]